MKVAIVEDRLDRLKQYTEFDLQNCDQVKIITGSDFRNLQQQLGERRIDILETFGCIAFHRSAMTDHLRDILKNYCRTKMKPLVFFSGGITSSVYKDYEFPYLHLNSREFYSTNLKMFLEELKKTGSVNLLVLQFGDQWKLSLLLNLRNRLAVSINREAYYKSASIAQQANDRQLIRRIADLQINSAIRNDLNNDKTQSIFSANEMSVLTAEQLTVLTSTINRLINDIA